MDKGNKDLQIFRRVYSAFTNNGYVVDDESPTGFSDEPMLINDLLVQADLTRFDMSLLL